MQVRSGIGWLVRSFVWQGVGSTERLAVWRKWAQLFPLCEAIDLRQIQIVEVSNDQLSKDDWHVSEIVGGRQLSGSTEDLHRK